MLYPNRKKYLQLMLLIFVLLIGCKFSKTYIPDQRRFYIFDKTYSSLDTVVIENYILYGVEHTKTLYNSWKKVELNSDSLIRIIKESINQIEGINFIFNDSLKNKKNKSFYLNPRLEYKKTDKEDIILLASEDTNVVSLIPIVLKSFGVTRDPSLGAGEYTYPELICHLSLAVYMVKNNKIIYFKQNRYVEIIHRKKHPYEYEDFFIPITQKHWDGLVREVMKEYIERLE